jgi:hypothetical protein
VSWKVTVRHGSKVERRSFESLDQALAAAGEGVDAVLGEGRLERAEGFRTYHPAELVHGRVEISGPGLLRGREGGIDVMGDGTLIPYAGSIRKRKLGAGTQEEALQRLREALA